MWEKVLLHHRELGGKITDEPSHSFAFLSRSVQPWLPWGRAAKQKHTLTFVIWRPPRVSSHTALAPALVLSKDPFQWHKAQNARRGLAKTCAVSHFIFSNGQCAQWGAWGERPNPTPHFNPSLVEQLWILRGHPFHPTPTECCWTLLPYILLSSDFELSWE